MARRKSHSKRSEARSKRGKKARAEHMGMEKLLRRKSGRKSKRGGRRKSHRGKKR